MASEHERRLTEYEAQVDQLQEMIKGLEEEVVVLRRRLQDAPKRVRTLEERLLETKEEGGADWLFAGRISPHKCQHDVLKAFAVYQKVYDPLARLWLVGASSADIRATAEFQLEEAAGSDAS